MNKQGTVRRLFPGGNTPSGFYSFYDQIVGPSANRIFVIKGGPGVGKSSFMRKIADELLDRGYDVELHQCSADNGSIDGVYVPALDVALIDGTAPHVVDPKNPGAVDEIIHLGDYWDEAGLRRHRKAILEINSEYSFRFHRAYDALAAARHFHDEWESYHRRGLDTAGLNARAEDLLAEVLPRRTGRAGRVRRLFASAITGDGPKNYLETLFGSLSKRYILSGEPGTGKATLVQKVVEAAVNKGYSVEAFHCPLDPTKVEHAIIKDLGVGLISSCWPHTYQAQAGDVTVETAAYLDPGVINRYQADIEGARHSFQAALDRAVAHMRTAKQLHDEMEKHYIPNMNFAQVEQRRQEVLAQILRYTNQTGSGAAD